MKNLQAMSIEPFQQFINKMNKDLAGWLDNQRNIQELLQDYKNTLVFLEQNFNCNKLLVELGEGCHAKAKRINQNIIIRCKEDTYVQFSKAEAIPVVKNLIKLYEQKLVVCKSEISKIMSSLKKVENLIASYQTLL